MTPDEFLGRTGHLLPALRERARRTEELRRLPDETFADFQEQGLLRALQPKRYGGYELDPGVFYQAVTEVAAVCGSSGWVFGVLGAHNWHLAILPPQAQEDVWGKDDSVQLSTSVAPTGKVERVAGGFRLSGRWSFSSGCDFCQWVVLGGIAPPLERDAPPDARVFLVPRADYRIEDNWHVTGLCGTGSKDIVIDEALVPEYRTHSLIDAFHLRHPGAAVNDAPLYRLPFALDFPLRHHRADDRRRARRARRVSRAVAAADQSGHPRVEHRRGPVHPAPPRRVRRRDRAARMTGCSAIFAEMMDSLAPAAKSRWNGGRATAGTPARRSTGACGPPTACSRRAAATASFSTTRSSAPGATCTQCGRMPATTRKPPRSSSPAPSSVCRQRFPLLAQPATQEPPMVAIRSVAHFSIPVSDVAASTRFYTEIVGCRHLATVAGGTMAFLMPPASA